MRKHEKACTNNPERKCGMCGVSGSEPIQKLIKILQKSPKKEEPNEIFITNIDEFKHHAEGCPACMLAAIRQSDLIVQCFDFNEEKARFWDAVNNGNFDDSRDVFYER